VTTPVGSAVDAVVKTVEASAPDVEVPIPKDVGSVVPKVLPPGLGGR
jgi:hypothetical protein